jgi:imidazolonepropionase-like amidohydrolase
MRVAAHAHGGQGITDAIRAGLDSVEHAPWLTDEQIDMMVAHNVFYVPTLTVHTALQEFGKEAIGLGDAAWNWLMQVCDVRWDSLARAHKAGVKIVAGTDAGFYLCHGENGRELAELVKGGLSPMEAIVAATRTAAECLDMDREIGTLAAGKYADLVLLAGNPLVDIGIVQDETRIAGVFKGGKRVK